jgi:hypothetical protein
MYACALSGKGSSDGEAPVVHQVDIASLMTEETTQILLGVPSDD